ncbi:MAG: hypothetical protein ACRBN8_26835 [Nannocystales bacterium]
MKRFPSHLLALLSVLMAPVLVAAAPPPDATPSFGHPERAPKRATPRKVRKVARAAGRSPAGRFVLNKHTELSPAHAKPVDWAFLKFLNSVYVSAEGYGKTGYASFKDGKGTAALVTKTKPGVARLVSCGIAVETAQDITVREVVYGEAVDAGTILVNKQLQPGTHSITFVAPGYTADRYQYVFNGGANWNLLYCDVYSAD